MALPSSGTISLSQVNTELGLAAATAISLNQANVRSLAGVASGTISMSNLHGKSNVQEVVFDNSGGAWGNWQDQNLRNIFTNSGIAITSSKVKVILRSITITSSAIGVAAIETGSGWPAGTNLEVVIESTSQIVGRRGTGGAGAAGTSSGVASAGSAGGRALTITSAISGGSIKITNQGAIRGGGGGGGGGGRASQTTGKGSTGYYAGGTGGTGYGSTGTAGAVAAATAGTVGSYGSGAGGGGGAAGTVGSAGAAGTGAYSSGGAGGGAAGPAIINSALATIVNTGTISGSLS